MSEYLPAAATKLGVPEPILKRSAEARAKATGVSVDDILQAWAAGGEAPPAASSEPRAMSQTSEQAPAATQAGVGSRESDSFVLAGVGSRESDSFVLAGVGSRASVVVGSDSQLEARSSIAPPPVPREVTPREALRYPAVITVPTAGLAERTISSMPRWLTVFFVIIPIFGLLQLAGATTNDCGQAGELAVDRVTGELVNCDGTPFTGRGEPGGGTDFVDLGEQVYTGQAVATANCQGCHGAQGQGGVGPPLASVAAVFLSCADHIEWVSKGTAGFQEEGRTTYGNTNKPVGGVGLMPGHARVLSAEQIASVVAFERVRFGGADEASVLTDCGLVVAAEPGSEGEATDGSVDTTLPEAGTPTTAP